MAFATTSKIKNFFLLLIFLIPFQQRLYKFWQPISKALVNPSWNLPPYFEVHLDGYITDFGLIALIGWCLKIKISKWSAFFWQEERKYLTSFLGFAFLSILASNHPGYLLQYWRWGHLALAAFLFYFMRQIQIDEKYFSKIAWTVFTAVMIECGLTIAQYFVQHSLGLKGLGEATLIASDYAGASFPMKDGTRWIFDSLFHVMRDKAYILRASGTLPHPNILGGFLVFGLLMTYYLYQRVPKKWVLALPIALQWFSLFMTYSRSALLTAGIVSIFWICWVYWREKKLSSLLAVITVSFFLCLGLFYPQLFERGGVISYPILAQKSDTVRLTLLEVGCSLIRAHPILGVGFNSYMLALQPLTDQGAVPVNFIHNIYMMLAVEVGILGLIPFLAFCFFVLKKGWERRSSMCVMISLLILVAFLGIGLVDFYPLWDQASRLIFFLSAGLIFTSITSES